MKRKKAITWFAVITAGAIAAPLLITGSREISRFNYLPAIDHDSFVSHNYYSLAYNEEHEQADWVSYMINSERLSHAGERTDRFRSDDSIATGSASSQDYSRSGYDRGHLAPAADMAFSETAMAESFYYSNISPQLPGFNRGIWKSLEDIVRDEARKADSVYVFTGPVYTGNETNIGVNEVTVPSAFYKIILCFNDNRMVARSWLLPHQEGLKEPSGFMVTVDSIEAATGIDFFPGLPDRLEKRIEKQRF